MMTPIPDNPPGSSAIELRVIADQAVMPHAISALRRVFTVARIGSPRSTRGGGARDGQAATGTAADDQLSPLETAGQPYCRRCGCTEAGPGRLTVIRAGRVVHSVPVTGEPFVDDGPGVPVGGDPR